MFKKALIVTFLIFMLMPGFVFASDVAVYVDHQKVNFPDQKPFIDENSRTLVPLRFIAEEMGASVEWLANDRMVIIEHEQEDTKEKSLFEQAKDFLSFENLMKQVDYLVNRTLISLQIGENRARVNGDWRNFDTQPIIVNGRTMVPLRFISETLDCQVDWEGTTRTVYIWTSEDIDKTIPTPPSSATTQFTQADYNRLNSYPYRTPQSQYFKPVGVLYEEDRENVELLEHLLVNKALPRYYSAQQPNLRLVEFLSDPKLMHHNQFGNNAQRGVLVVKCEGNNTLDLTPGKTYEVDVEFAFGYTSGAKENPGDPPLFAWALARAPFYLDDFKEVLR